MLILQTNLNRSRIAHDLLEQFIREENIDLALVSEPNKRYVEERAWITDVKGDVAVRICTQSAETEIGRIAREEGIVLVELKEVEVCGGYISPNIGIDSYSEYINRLERVLRDRNKPVIVAGDFNSKSEAWGSAKTDQRGELLEELFSAGQLTVANTGGEPTFARGTQASHLDVTAHSDSLTDRVKEWKVWDTENMSDHRYITFHV